LKSVLATHIEISYLRRWAGCPVDFSQTEPSVASKVYGKLASIGVSIEAWEILNYLRGKTALTAEHFEMLQDAYMCDSSADRAAIRAKYDKRWRDRTGSHE